MRFEEGCLWRFWNSDLFQQMRSTMVSSGSLSCCGYDPVATVNRSRCVSPITEVQFVDWEGTDLQKENDLRARRSFEEREEMVSHYPVSMEMQLDTICNLSCRMCYLTPKRRKKLEMPLPVECFRDELEEFLRFGRELIVIGGEPTISPRFPTVLQSARRANGAKISVITNGHNLIDTVVPDVDIFHNIHVSIDAATAATYSKIRLGGNWDGLNNNLKAVCVFGRPYYVIFGHVISGLNYEEMPEMVRMADRYSVDCVSFSEVTTDPSWMSPRLLQDLTWHQTAARDRFREKLDDAICEAQQLGVHLVYCLPSIAATGRINDVRL